MPIIRENFPRMKAPGGTEVIKANIVENGGFEIADPLAGGVPKYYPFIITADVILNASYQDDAHSGSYGYYLSVKATDQTAKTENAYRFLGRDGNIPYLEQGIILNLWYKMKANPDILNGGSAYCRITVQTSSYSYYLNYYFSANSLPGNNTFFAYFDARVPIGSWVNLHRNLTQDFIDAFGIPIDSNTCAFYLYFYITSPINPTGATELLIDDTSLVNSSSYDFLHLNGDFEYGTGQYWTNTNRSPSSIRLTSLDYREGNRAANLTVSTKRPSSYSYTSLIKYTFTSWSGYYDGLYVNKPDDLVLNFDWKFSNHTISGSNPQYAFALLHFGNMTKSIDIYFCLGTNTGDLHYSNYSSSTYQLIVLGAPGYELTNTWHHFSIDIFTLLDSLNLKNLCFYQLEYYLYLYSESYTYANLLVDDLQFITYPAADPGFENCFDWLSNNGLITWYSTSAEYTNRTEDAHSGFYAANISSYNNKYYQYCYRRTFLHVEHNLYTDFWWKINKLIIDGNAYSSIKFIINETNIVNYILGSAASSSFVNTSTNVFYFVENFNMTGNWNNLFRNVSNDVFDAFGENNWYIIGIELGSYATGNSVVETIYDDIQFVRDIQPPEINNPTVSPSEPEYYDSIVFSIEAIDNFAVQEVIFYYRLNGLSWQEESMTFQGTAYQVTLPPLDWNTEVEYYFFAVDSHGFSSFLGSDVNPYQIIIRDSVNPELNIQAPVLTTINGTVQFNVTGSDIGSGIGSFEVDVNGTLLYSGATIENVTWNTEQLENGKYSITFILRDNAGNEAIQTYTYTVSNPVPWTKQVANFFKQWWPYLTAGAGGLIIGILTIVIVVKVRKKKCAT